MRQSLKYEFWVGLFVLIGLAALMFLSLRVANVQGFSSEKTYTLYATFDNIGGLKVRAPVKVGGVVIGRVSDISLDADNYTPKVTLAVNEKFNTIPDTSSLSIKTAGLLGEQYIALNIGFVLEGETSMLKEGDTFFDTNSAMVLEDLIGQFLYGDKKEQSSKTDTITE
ncbi:outer membrane lipid asymmetry maintenance protein MlaD [Phocoenobacter skyensis]|uniref:Outer membrane lipid asymmetry maintenance protein MlaD n=1 Tax=Phocoenobacter skyensis TaxID=97481 RepID=A0A1H7ZBD0_9PAST|nr:outer membrane lipid asymmetry maintenance protein MlaD [Pasteurella skyensis]MDP8080186.1 outer membrane lipid asymmetry maintenance protein MlaD [Pasteurella skyensis]MDP8086192.1 outer membrane lipid asymmetry maintenance protein MlaD [Pasteurella skyensis]MDP8163175.1 outer membrane lipid asymmetry maintenance protein MlaD [Pasteurella skyensis]MDP8170146.1 outer membrane lipid asymmetry maintenance protein MlaD [Pasteurella skyensis]MDP8173350.1 outer membrane lipid asymmetry maintenan